MPNSCAGVSFTVAMAFRAKAVRTSRCGNYGCFAPKLCGRIEAIAKACVPKLCTVERTGQEAEAKIGVILALHGY